MCGPTSEEREREREIGDITKLKPDARQTEKREGKNEGHIERVINYDYDYELIITRRDSGLLGR
jgi:hypothetical protein